jgi:hypothetical protein
MTDWARWHTASVCCSDDRGRDTLMVEAVRLLCHQVSAGVGELYGLDLVESLRATSTVGP